MLRSKSCGSKSWRSKSEFQQVKDDSVVSFYLDDTAAPNHGETQISVNTKELWADWNAEMIMAQIRKRAQSGKLILLNQYTSITFQIVY